MFLERVLQVFSVYNTAVRLLGIFEMLSAHCLQFQWKWAGLELSSSFQNSWVLILRRKDPIWPIPDSSVPLLLVLVADHYFPCHFDFSDSPEWGMILLCFFCFCLSYTSESSPLSQKPISQQLNLKKCNEILSRDSGSKYKEESFF